MHLYSAPEMTKTARRAPCAGRVCATLIVLVVGLALARLGPGLMAWSASPSDNHTIALARIQLFDLTGPRILAALVAGACLAMSGTLFQALTRNPLASPDLLGITHGAQLGLLATMILPGVFGAVSVPLLFAGGLFAASCVSAAAGGWHATPLRLVLAGSVCMLTFSAISTMTLVFFEQNIAGVALWASGSLYQPGAEGLQFAVAWMIVPVVALPFVLRPLGVMTLGDCSAASIGVAVDRTRFTAMVLAVAFASIAVSLAGPLSFIGLLAPNLLRAVRGFPAARLCILLPLSALLGGTLVLATDSAVLGLGLDDTLPTGVAVAILGTPLMLLMLRRSGGQSLGNGSTASAHAISPPDPRSIVSRISAMLQGGPAWLKWGGVLSLMAALVIGGVSFGEVQIRPLDWLSLLGRLPPGANAQDQIPLTQMLLELRLPRLLSAMFAGALLAASGVVLQSIVRNPLAGPEVLGVTQGAGFSTLITLVFWPLSGHGALAAASLVGGGATLAMTLLLNRRHEYAPFAVALTGIMLGALWTTMSQWLITQQGVQPARFMVWLMGGTYGRSWSEVKTLLYWGVLIVPCLMLLARPLDLLALGDQQAAALGVPVSILRPVGLLIAMLAACAAVAAVGPVAFIGLMAPHLAVMSGARSYRMRLAVASLYGTLLLATADIAARTMFAPREIPAGVLTALIGAPFLLWLLVRQARSNTQVVQVRA